MSTDQINSFAGGRGRLFLRADKHRRSDSPFAKIERRALEMRQSKRKEKIEKIRSESRHKAIENDEEGYHTGKEELESTKEERDDKNRLGLIKTKKRPTNRDSGSIDPSEGVVKDGRQAQYIEISNIGNTDRDDPISPTEDIKNININNV